MKKSKKIRRLMEREDTLYNLCDHLAYSIYQLGVDADSLGEEYARILYLEIGELAIKLERMSRARVRLQDTIERLRG